LDIHTSIIELINVSSQVRYVHSGTACARPVSLSKCSSPITLGPMIQTYTILRSID